MKLLSRAIARITGFVKAPASNGMPAASTQETSRSGPTWAEDGTTAPVWRATHERLAWPARDKARQGGRGTAPLLADEAVTQLIGDNPATTLDKPEVGPPPVREVADDTTRLLGADAHTPEPTVGWIVVVDGPGRGRALPITAGANAIGRAPEQRLCLNFGDVGISRERHAAIIYEPSARIFYLQAGEGRGLTYLNEELLLAPRELVDRAIITVGNTRLQFVAFCGPQFGW